MIEESRMSEKERVKIEQSRMSENRRLSQTGPNKGHITPHYWLDHCPVCEKLAISACRCNISHRKCESGHQWYWSAGHRVIESSH